MRLIGFTFTMPNIISDSTGRTIACPSFQSALDFLSEPFEGKNSSISKETCYRFTWNTDAFISQLFSLLIPETDAATARSLITQLITTTYCKFQFPDSSNPSSNVYTIYEIWYVKEKGFSITNLSHHSPFARDPKFPFYRSSFYHLSQFFPPDLPTPSTPLEIQACASLLLQNIKNLGFFASSFYSPINILEPRLFKLHIPTHASIPKNANLYAISCSAGAGWQEGHQIGYFPKVYDWDLSSAYSSIYATLLDIRNGLWKRNKTSSITPNAKYGYYHCSITIYPTTTVSPIFYKRHEEPQTISPIGTWEGHLTKSEIEFIRTWKIGEVDIIDSWEWIPTENQLPVYPLAPLISNLQSARSRHKDNLIAQRLIKGMLVGLYGKTAKEGPFYNPVYTAEILSQTRIKVANFIYSHSLQSSLVHISTDGLLTTTPITLTPSDITEGWKLNYTGEAIVLNHTDVYFSDKKPLGYYISEVKDMINSNLSAPFWESKHQHIVTLGDVRKSGKLSTLGTTISVPGAVSLFGSHDRHFPSLPLSGKDLLTKTYYSTPLDISDLGK
jgi:hypothetical protein